MTGIVAPTFEWSNKLLVLKINSFVRLFNKFCLEKNIPPSFYNFLFYNFNGITSETYRFLYTAPKEYLANSRAFRHFYYKLDKDFRNDIFTAQELSTTVRELQINHELQKYLQKLMQEDSIL